MSLFLIPASVVKRLDELRRTLFGKETETRKNPSSEMQYSCTVTPSKKERGPQSKPDDEMVMRGFLLKNSL